MHELQNPDEQRFACAAQTLRKAARLITRRYEDGLRPFNLTASQFSILQIVMLYKSAPFKAISSKLGIEQTTLSRLLKLLEKRGLIEVTVDVKDSRSRVISLTRQGRKLFTEAYVVWEHINNDSISRLNKNDWENAQVCLSALSR